MASFIERVKQVDIPLDEAVVIGSGLLDAWALRDANDIDLIVSPQVFAALEASGEFEKGNRYNSDFLTKDSLEIWTDWGEGADFQELVKTAVVIDGVQFVAPAILIDRKQARGSEKDLRDIALLQEYIRTHVAI